MNTFSTRVRQGMLVATVAVACMGVNGRVARADCQSPEVQNAVAALNQKARYLAEEVHFGAGNGPQSVYLQHDAADLFAAAQNLANILASGAPAPQLFEGLIVVEGARQHIQKILQQAGSTPAANCNLREMEGLIALLTQRWTPAATVPPCAFPQPVPQQGPQPGLVSLNIVQPQMTPPGLALHARGKHFVGQQQLVAQNFAGRPPYVHPAAGNRWNNLPVAGPGQQVTLQLGNMRLGFVAPGR